MSAAAQTMAEVSAASSFIPVGAELGYAGASDPDAFWFLEDGRAISRTTYSVLFALIGTTFGAGNGSTTFNIPDKRGRVDVRPDNMGTAQGDAGRLTASDTRGSSGGEEKHVLTSGEEGEHGHTDGTLAAAGHVHYSPWPFVENGGAGNFVGAMLSWSQNALGANGYVLRGRNTVAENFSLIGLLQAGASSHGGAAPIGDTSATYDVASSSAGADVTGSTGGRTGYVGPSAHNNMQPFVVTNSIIRVLP